MVAPSPDQPAATRPGLPAHPKRWRTALSTTEVFAVVGLLAACAACLMSPSGIEDGPVICPFRNLTGLPCPGCGLTRSWVYITHGWWRDSFAAHPFGAALLVGIVALGLAVILARVRRRPPPNLDRIVRNRLLQVVIAGWITWGVVRLALAI